MYRPLIAFLLLTQIIGCGAPVRLDATDKKTLHASLDKAQAQIFKKDLPKFTEARKQFDAIYFRPGGPPIGVPDFYAVNKMTASEFHAYVQDIIRLTKTKKITEESLRPENFYPSPAITQRLLEQYQLEKLLQEISKDATWMSGKNTVDQYPITDFTIIVPPPGDLSIAMDKVRLIVTMKNMSGFDAYQPTFKATISMPGQSYPIFTSNFTDVTSKKDAIRPYSEIVKEYTCCSIASDPYNNRLLKNLPVDATIRVEVTSIKNFNNVELLDTMQYSQKENERGPIIEACINILSQNLKTWSPPTRPEDGECGQYNDKYINTKKIAAIEKTTESNPDIEVIEYE